MYFIGYIALEGAFLPPLSLKKTNQRYFGTL
jgi:hypothetical protein